VRWRDIRAGLIAFAIFLALVEGCPIPPPHEARPWQQGYVGIIRPIQKTILVPFAWIPKYLRISQRFALFQAAEPDRFRLEIHTRTADGADTLIFRAGDDEHAEYADRVAHRRVRGVWNPTDRPTSQYTSFARWFAGVVFAERPEVQVVVFRQEKLLIEGGVPHGTGKFTFELYQYRPKGVAP